MYLTVPLCAMNFSHRCTEAWFRKPYPINNYSINYFDLLNRWLIFNLLNNFKISLKWLK